MSNQLRAQEFARRYPAIARAIEWLVLWPFRIRIRRAERIRVAVLEDTIATLRREHSKCQERSLVDMAIILNVALYTLLFDRDFAALKEFFLSANNDWDRRFVARQMAVMLYEGTRDLPNLIGKDFRAMLKRLDISESRIGEVNQIRGKLAAFKRAHSERLKALRNVMAAHRDRDVTLQFSLLDGLDRFEVYRTAASFYQIVRDLTPVLTDIMNDMRDLRRLLKQLSAARIQSIP